MTSTNPTVRGLAARRASLAPGAYLAIVHVSQGEQLGPIGRGAVLPEVLDHVAAVESELAESRATLENMLAARALDLDDLESLRSSVTLAGAALGVTSADPDELSRRARLAADSVALHVAAVARVRDVLDRMAKTSNASASGTKGGKPGLLSEALRLLDEGLARSRGAR